eukprot:14089774-Heterocapsa_arctica.AAC.1
MESDSTECDAVCGNNPTARCGGKAEEGPTRSTTTSMRSGRPQRNARECFCQEIGRSKVDLQIPCFGTMFPFRVDL